MTRIPRPADRVGFIELARHLGIDHDGVSELLAAGKIKFTRTPSYDIRIISRQDANEYLKAKRLPLLPAVRPEDA